MREADARVAVAEICRRMYVRGLIAAADGNVSVRLGKTRMLVTPSGLSKGFLKPADMIVTDMAGRKVSGSGRPTAEIRMHVLVYAERPEVQAVVHGHPPTATALALAGESLERCVLPESCLVLGAVPTASYATPFTAEVAATLQTLVKFSNAIVMDRHGALALGRSLEEAYNRLETLEHSARITHAAQQLRPVAPLSPEQVEKLRGLAQSLGLPGPPRDCGACGVCDACPSGRGPTPGAPRDPGAGRAAGAPAARRRGRRG
jgi:L-fuculose-phosphate aldolase